jgi:ABC-2 type transport system ATP-binding protein
MIPAGSTPSDAQPPEPALAAHRLSKRFGDRDAFDDVSFEIGRGEVFGFLGPNGAGKTTTVRTLGALIAPTSGSAVVAGFPLLPENGVEIRRRIAVMPESPGLYLRLSVMENLACFADLYEVADPRGRIDAALQAVNLVDRAKDPCGPCRRGCASGSPSRGRSSASRRSSSSTSRRPGSIRSPHARSTSSSTASVSGT